jgi:hypothetical protein
MMRAMTEAADNGARAETDAQQPEEGGGRSLTWLLRDRLRRSKTLRKAVVGYRHRQLRPDDMFIASFPRSGNTWARFILADLMMGRPVDFIEVEKVSPSVGVDPSDSPTLTKGGRLVKTHEVYRPSYERAVYLVRDARDVLASWYRVTREDPNDLKDADTFIADFVTERASPYGPWHEHVRSWLAAAERSDQIRVFRFEDLKRDPIATFGEIADYVGIDATPQAIEQALERNNPAAMRERERQNEEFLRASFGYMSRGTRAGESGAWDGVLTEEHLRALGPALELNRELGYGVPVAEPRAVGR